MTTRISDEPALGRRAFLRSAALIAAAAPIVTEASLAHAAAQTTTAPPSGMALHGQSPNAPPSGAVLINANENPLGPSKAACDAIARVAPLGGRYDLNGETDLLVRTFAAQNGLKPEYVAAYAGSSEPLHYSVLAFTSPTKSFVTADPSYEAGMYAARTSQAKVVKAPLTADCAHDVKAMVAAVAQGKDLIVLRTFSKIYGMAGIRCGFAVGRPDLLAKLKPFGQNAMPITGSAAARASLEDASLVPERRKIIGDTRRDTIAWLKAGGYKVIGDPQTNCFMIDTGRNGKAVFAAMKAKNVLIGRTWPIWPNAVRVSVGTPEEMAAFKV